jgi:hypothetical protein
MRLRVFARESSVIIDFTIIAPLCLNQNSNVKGDPFAYFRNKSAHFVFDQPGDFSLFGKSLSFNILFGVNQLAVTLYIEDTASPFDQFNI